MAQSRSAPASASNLAGPAETAAALTRRDRLADVLGRPILNLDQGFSADFHVLVGELHVEVKLVGKRGAIGIMQMGVGGVMAPLDIDHVATRIRAEPFPVAVVVVAVFVGAQSAILRQRAGPGCRSGVALEITRAVRTSICPPPSRGMFNDTICAEVTCLSQAVLRARCRRVARTSP
jgi:hypothetical protein